MRKVQGDPFDHLYRSVLIGKRIRIKQIKKKAIKMNKRKKFLRKNAKILIRVSPDEKAYAREAADEDGYNVSELIRKLLRDYERDKIIKTIMKISERSEALFSRYKSAMDSLLKTKRKKKG
jgi:hypothetical protein